MSNHLPQLVLRGLGYPLQKNKAEFPCRKWKLHPGCVAASKGGTILMLQVIPAGNGSPSIHPPTHPPTHPSTHSPTHPSFLPSFLPSFVLLHCQGKKNGGMGWGMWRCLTASGVFFTFVSFAAASLCLAPPSLLYLPYSMYLFFLTSTVSSSNFQSRHSTLC